MVIKPTALTYGSLDGLLGREVKRPTSDIPKMEQNVEPQGSKARGILGRAAFGVDWQEVMSNWDAESELEYVGILDMCSGLPLALEIAGSGVYADYEDIQDGEGRKDPSFAVKNYWEGVKMSSLKYLRGANRDYHRDGLKLLG